MDKVFLRVILLLWTVGFSFFPSAGSALPQSRKPFFLQFQSPFLEMIDEISPYYRQGTRPVPFFMRWLSWERLKSNPQARPVPFSSNCQPDKRLNGAESEILKAWADCEAAWETGDDNFVSNTVGSLRVALNPLDHPMATQVLLHLPNGVKLKGFLALKGDQKPRPLIIFRAGLFANMNEFFAERGFFMQAFDASPFNVLILENLSGWDFIRNNRYFAMGGFDEGLQNILIAKRLQDPSEPLSKIVQSVHLMATSMGGHGAFFASLINDLNQFPIKSTFLYCPLVNFRETLDFHLAQGFSLSGINFWAKNSMVGLKQRYPQIRDEYFISDLLQEVEANYIEPLSGREVLKQVKVPQRIQQVFDQKIVFPPIFWQVNSFWDYFNKPTTPLLIFSTKKDPVVPYEFNTGRIQDRFPVKTLRSGYHCSLQVSHHMEPLAKTLRSFVLANTPSGGLDLVEYRLPLDQETQKNIGANPWHHYFSVAPDGKNLHLHIIADLFSLGFLRYQESYVFEVPWVNLEYAWSFEGSEQENAILTRWANINIQVAVIDNQLVLSAPVWKPK